MKRLPNPKLHEAVLSNLGIFKARPSCRRTSKQGDTDGNFGYRKTPACKLIFHLPATAIKPTHGCSLQCRFHQGSIILIRYARLAMQSCGFCPTQGSRSKGWSTISEDSLL
jgi:hypothetical protein